MIDGCNEIRAAAESERSVTDRLDLVVDTLHGPVGKSRLGPGENSIQVGPNHAYESFKRLQPRPHGGVHPFDEMLFGPPRLHVAPEQLKGLLQVPGPD